MNGEGKKYQIDTEENRRFLKEIRENLLEFGKQFPSPAGSSWYLGDDGTPWKSLPKGNLDYLPDGPCVQHWHPAGISGK